MPHTSVLLDLTAAFIDLSGNLPFGTFSSDSNFQSDANSMVKYVYRKLGGSVLNVELNNIDVYVALEDSTLEYSSTVNSYHAKSMLADIIGSQTGSLSGSENKLAKFNLALAKRKSQAYSSEIALGGTRTLHSASIDLNKNQQHYDLKVLLSSSSLVTGSQRAEIKEVFHFSPTAAYRFFDTTSAINYLHNQFSFESFTPETIFYLLPIWEDVLRAQMLETSHNIRRSNYSYDITNNVLRIYPIPDKGVKLYFTYYLVNEDPFNDADDPWVRGVTNLSNVPFGAISYSKINSMGRQWIRRFAFALAKEILGQVRSKIGNVPIPNGELILNGSDLIANAREEQTMLREELKAMLEETTYQALMAKEIETAEAIKAQFSKIPLFIYTGTFWPLLFLSTYILAKCLYLD